MVVLDEAPMVVGSQTMTKAVAHQILVPEANDVLVKAATGDVEMNE